MKSYQFDCKEGKKIDQRQANAVLRHRPDVVIFENRGHFIDEEFPEIMESIKEL